MNWNYRGTPSYLMAQGERLGLSRILTDRARHNAEIHRVSLLIGQLCERYHRTFKGDDGRPILDRGQISQVQATLDQCERELEKLHVLAAAAQAIIDEAYAAFGLEAPERAMRVWCDYDDPEPRPAVNGAVEAIPGTT